MRLPGCEMLIIFGGGVEKKGRCLFVSNVALFDVFDCTSTPSGCTDQTGAAGCSLGACSNIWVYECFGEGLARLLVHTFSHASVFYFFRIDSKLNGAIQALMHCHRKRTNPKCNGNTNRTCANRMRTNRLLQGLIGSMVRISGGALLVCLWHFGI